MINAQSWNSECDKNKDLEEEMDRMRFNHQNEIWALRAELDKRMADSFKVNDRMIEAFMKDVNSLKAKIKERENTITELKEELYKRTIDSIKDKDRMILNIMRHTKVINVLKKDLREVND